MAVHLPPLSTTLTTFLENSTSPLVPMLILSLEPVPLQRRCAVAIPVRRRFRGRYQGRLPIRIIALTAQPDGFGAVRDGT